jgi:inosine-uridine nucleoside N-ribohydrolase
MRPLIIDTDVGFDDLVALQCLLHHHRLDDDPPPTFITTVGGVLLAPAAADTLRRLFPHVNVATGRNAPGLPDPLPSWLADYRTWSLEAFVREHDAPLEPHVHLDQDHHHNRHDDRDEALMEVMKFIQDAAVDTNDDASGVDVICLGPLTNVAYWLEHCQDNGSEEIFSNITRVFILGGNHPREDVLSAEFNFSLDPQATFKVLHSPLLQGKLHLLTTTVGRMDQLRLALGEQVMDDFIRQKRTARNKCLLGNLLMFDEWGYSLSCDPVCAFALHHPTSVRWESMPVEIDKVTGILAMASSLAEEEQKPASSCVQIATEIDLSGYLQWIHSAMDATSKI